MPPKALPLSGLKVLELGHYIAAPFATRLLADLGAEVIKVEPPEGDPVRGWGSQENGHAVWFSVHGRNKLSVTLDLKSTGGQGARPQARAARRRAGGEFPPRPAGAHRPRPADAARSEPAPRHRPHQRLRPGRALPRQAGLRRDRRGDGRPAPPHRQPRPDRPAAAALRRLDQRRPGRHVRGHGGRLRLLGPRPAGRRRQGPRHRRRPGLLRVQPDGGDAAGIRAVRLGAAAAGRRHRHRGADQHLSLRRRQVALHRRQFRPDLPPPDGGDRPAGPGRRPALRHQRRCAAPTSPSWTPPSPPGPAPCPRPRREAVAGSGRGAVLAPLRHARLRRGPAFPGARHGDARSRTRCSARCCTPPRPSAWTASRRATWCAGPAPPPGRTTTTCSGSC